MALFTVLQQLRVGPAPANVLAAQLQLVLPILRGLGWDDADAGQVEVGRTVGPGAEAAFTLLVPRGERSGVWSAQDSRAAALIAVEADAADLSRRAAGLLPHAAREHVDICALTSGLRWDFYLPRRLPEPPQTDACRFAQLDLRTDPLDQLQDQFESYLSRDALIQQSALRAAEHTLSARLNAERLEAEMPSVWHRLLAEPDQLLIELVQEEVHKSIGLRPSPEQAAELLRSSAPNKPRQTPKRPPRKGQQSTGRKITPRPASFRLWGVEREFSTWKAMWIAVAAAVHERHTDDFERALQPRGRARPYVARSSAEVRTAAQVPGTPYFLEVDLGARDLIRRIENLLEVFGYPKTELELIYPDSSQ